MLPRSTPRHSRTFSLQPPTNKWVGPGKRAACRVTGGCRLPTKSSPYCIRAATLRLLGDDFPDRPAIVDSVEFTALVASERAEIFPSVGQEGAGPASGIFL